MHKLTCDQTRRYLDELMLSDEISEATGVHLDECAQCREFHSTQTKLRQLVGSLGTVPAPADFDFKLRARLASGPASSGFNFWPLAKWSLTGVAAVLLFFGGFSVVRQMTKQSPPPQLIVNRPGPVPQPSTPSDQTPGAIDKKVIDSGSVASLPQSPVTKGPKTPGIRKEKRPQLTAQDFSSDQAEVKRLGREDVIFRVDATEQPITVSLDDGRGNARTISVPTVTFGSQRVIGKTNQFAPKGVW